MRTRPRRKRPVSLTESMEDPSLIAPVIRSETDDYGDPEEARELAARREEGRIRHGFRSLIDELDP
jgi:hypothetical protein